MDTGIINRTGRNENYSAVIDGIRFLVCLALALGHYEFGYLISTEVEDILISGFASAIFFVLSGFVVVNSSHFWKANWYQSATSRISRLWPAHFVGFAVLVPFAVVGVETMPFAKLGKVLTIWSLGLQSISFDYAFAASMNAPAWSVTALLIGGLVLPALKKWRFNEFSNQTLWLCLLGLVTLRIGIEVVHGLPNNEDLLTRHIAILPRVISIFSGGIVAIILRKQSASDSISWLKTDAALLSIMGLIVCLLYTASVASGKQGLYMVAHGGMTVPSLLLIVSAYLNRASLHRMLDRPVVKKAADISIYIYLFHVPVYLFVDAFNKRLSSNGQGLIDLKSFPGILLMVLVTIALSAKFVPLGLYAQGAMNRMWMKLEARFASIEPLPAQTKMA
jgi:peptidoglycan/LPS O-acetylase OafA/YrhL